MSAPSGSEGGGEVGGVRSGPSEGDTVWECGPHANAWNGHDARCRRITKRADAAQSLVPGDEALAEPPRKCQNEARPKSAGNTPRPLTHSLDSAKEGIAMQATQDENRQPTLGERYDAISDRMDAAYAERRNHVSGTAAYDAANDQIEAVYADLRALNAEAKAL